MTDLAPHPNDQADQNRAFVAHNNRSYNAFVSAMHDLTMRRLHALADAAGAGFIRANRDGDEHAASHALLALEHATLALEARAEYLSKDE